MTSKLQPAAGVFLLWLVILIVSLRALFS